MLGGGSAIGSAVIKILPDLSGFGDKVGSEVEKSISGKLSGIGSSLTNTLTPAAAAVAGAMGTIAGSFNKGVDEIRVGTGKTGAALKELVDSARAVGSQVTQPFEEVSTVLASLATRLGLTGKPLQDLTKQILDFSFATGTDAVDNTAKFLDIITKWKVPAEQAAGAIDMILRASQATGTPVGILADQLGKFSGVFKNLGMDMPQSLALIGELEKRGIDSTKALSGLNMGFANLAKGLKDKVPPAFKDVSAAWKDAVAAIKVGDLTKAFDILANSIIDAKTPAEGTARAIEVFGKKAGPLLAGALRSGAFAVDDLGKKIKNGSETSGKAADDVTHFGDKVKIAWNAIALAVAPVAEKAAVAATIVSGIGPALQGLGAAGKFLGPIAGSVGLAIESLVRLAAQSVVTGVTSAASYVAMAASAVASAVTTAAAWVASWVAQAAAAVVNAAIIAAAWLIAYAPIILLGLAIAAFVVLVVKNWDTIKAATLAVWNAIKAALVAVWNFIKTAVTTYFNVYQTIILAVWNALKAATSAVWNGIKAVLTAVWNAIKAAVTTYFNAYKAVITAVWNAIKAVTSAVWNGINAVLTGAWNTIKSVVTTGINAVNSVLSAGWNIIKSGASGAWNAVVGAFESAWSRITGIVARIKAAFCDLPFVPCSPIPLVVDAKTAVNGVLTHFKDLQRDLPRLTSGLDMAMPSPAFVAAGVRPGSAPSGELAGIRAQLGALEIVVNQTIKLDGREIYRNQEKHRAYAERANG